MILRAAGALLLLACLACSGSGDPLPPEVLPPALGEDPAAREPAETPAEPEESAEGATTEPLARSSVEIYFPSALGNGLVGEYREIFDTVTPGDRAKQIIADLISGPTSPEALRVLPPGTRLRQVFVLDNGVAYIDFSAELTEGLGGGSMSELLAVYSIIDSVAFGVQEIQRVALLVNGRPLETLNGHLDLRRPLRPDSQLILGSIVVQQTGREPTDLFSTSRPPVPARP